MHRPLLLGLSLMGLLSPARAEPPAYQIPPSVLAELRLLDSRFELALAADCNARRCFSKGCTYVAHTVTDRPRSGSLPGLGLDPGPGSVAPQEYLTQAQCTFTHEPSDDNADMSALARRLQMKLSSGWVTVSVNHQELLPLPEYVREAPEPEAAEAPAEEPEVEPPPPVEPEPWGLSVAGRELWAELLPHFYWMLGIVLTTLSAVMLIWAGRRVGQASIEEQALLAQLAQPEAPAAPEVAPVVVEQVEEDDPQLIAARQAAAWTERLESLDPAAPDPELAALVRELLRARALPLLAKAVLRFPLLPTAFPTGPDVASAKVELADYLKTVDLDALPSDAELFAALDRHALVAALVTQPDARVVRSIREDFGPGGLAALIQAMPARLGALLFALAPPATRLEVVRLLTPAQVAAMAEQLLRSNRLNPAETAVLFEALEAAREGRPTPDLTVPMGDSDLGAPFDAAGALSALLPMMSAEQRSALFRGALHRFHGSLPSWTRGILSADMLFALPDEARTDLLLAVEVEPLAAWISLLDDDTRAHLLGPLPQSLRRSIEAVSVFPSRAQQVALAERGRVELARGFQGQLARARTPFERVVAPAAP
ncbi:MAG: hypothetical protein H6739_15720 [Alphaproteobacteria bacterium]|nr:hypothetical protein [Alphaproteobacteria bacterium]MCB9761290.1 hypothetical protein [Alphaproteobacteria bacterium]